MKKNMLWMIATILICGTNAQAQTKRSDAFRAKYELKEVVVMSRHNIRSPLTSGGAAYQRVTPHTWFKWSSPSSQLSLRGGVLETEMGQFFRQWVVSEGVLPENYRPEGDEVLFYANSRQRTFATAKYFSAGFLPFANVEITHKLDEDKMDPVFTPQFTKMNDTYRQQVLADIQALNGGPQAWMAAQQPTLDLIVRPLRQRPVRKSLPHGCREPYSRRFERHDVQALCRQPFLRGELPPACPKVQLQRCRIPRAFAQVQRRGPGAWQGRDGKVLPVHPAFAKRPLAL